MRYIHSLGKFGVLKDRHHLQGIWEGGVGNLIYWGRATGIILAGESLPVRKGMSHNYVTLNIGEEKRKKRGRLN